MVIVSAASLHDERISAALAIMVGSPGIEPSPRDPPVVRLRRPMHGSDGPMLVRVRTFRLTRPYPFGLVRLQGSWFSILPPVPRCRFERPAYP